MEDEAVLQRNLTIGCVQEKKRPHAVVGVVGVVGKNFYVRTGGTFLKLAELMQQQIDEKESKLEFDICV